MLKINRSDKYDIYKYAERISDKGYILYDREAFNKEMLNLQEKSNTLRELARNLMICRSGLRCMTLSREAIYEYLTIYECCPAHYFSNRKTAGVSLNSKDVLGRLYANGYAKEFLDYYITSKSLDSKVSKMKSILKDCNDNSYVSEDGMKLSKIPFSVNQQQNLRFNYSNFDIIGQIPKLFASTICVPDGYCLAWGDFAQSDFRIAYNLFMRSEANDKIMNSYSDKYEALARIVSMVMGTPFNYEKFKNDRKLYKLLTLATVYGTRKSMVQEENAFIFAFSKFLEKCPKYTEYYDRILRRIQLGMPLNVVSYFGYEQITPILYDKQATLYKCLNTPIQTGTSEIMLFTVNSILDKFYSRGWTKDDIGIYLVRHDEPVFWMKKEVLRDAWIFEECRHIQVDDWSELLLDFNFGVRYSVPDETLTQIAKESVSNNFDKITKVEPSVRIGNEFEYDPIPFVGEINIHSIDLGDKVITTLYSPTINSVTYALIKKTPDIKVELNIKNVVRKFTSVFENDVNGVIVSGNFVNDSDSANGHFIKYVYEDNASKLSTVQTLCNNLVEKYCKREGIDFNRETILEEDSKVISEIKEIRF